MKFRIVVGSLIAIILASFAYAMYLTYKLEVKNQQLTESYEQLKIKDDSLSIAFADLQHKDSLLQDTMKELNVYTDEAKEQRRKQLKREKYKLGIEVQARNQDYMELIAYTIGTGFRLDYANQERSFVNPSIMYYYSEDGKRIAEELREDLKKEFSSLADFEVKRGGSSRPANTITAKLRFN